MLRRPLRILALAALLGTAACATMISGHNQQVPIVVQPVGATVCLDGDKIGTSPMIAKLSRKRSHVLVIEQEGYERVIRPLATEVNPWIALNFIPFILIPGPFGLVVDVASGAVNTFNVGSFDFYLQKADASAPAVSHRTPCSPT